MRISVIPNELKRKHDCCVGFLPDCFSARRITHAEESFAHTIFTENIALIAMEYFGMCLAPMKTKKNFFSQGGAR
jgi:hypothetical protein